MTNVGESAYEAQLFIEHSSSLSYIGTKQSGSTICNLHNSTIVSCALGNPLKKDKSLNIQVRFDPLVHTENKLKFVVFVNSTSKEVSRKDPTVMYARVSKRAELTIKG